MNEYLADLLEHIANGKLPPKPPDYRYLHIGLGCYVEIDNAELECEVRVWTDELGRN